MRIGFVLADLNTGSAASLWPSVASMFPDDGKDTLVVFAGGRLNSSAPFEQMKNSIYRFVRPHNLDGAIIWSSSLTGNAKPEDILETFRDMLDLPVVTIDGKTASHPQIPDVRFNAYEGSYLITEHCIEHHGAKRVAYIRGPETHNSAQERYKAFRDALEKHGIVIDESLISDPAPWDSGDMSMRQIIDERGKTPGKDFDTILCASDLMLYKASLELAKHGYEIGKDIRACGFNDSLESRLLNIPVSTVRLPYAGLGFNAVIALRTLMEGKSCGDRKLNTRPIIRRSCGCGMGFIKQELYDASGIADMITEIFSIPRDESQAMIEKALDYPGEENLRVLLDRLCQSGADVFEVFEVMSCLDNLISEDEKRHVILYEIAKSLLPSVLDRNISMKSYEERRKRNAFNRFNNELLKTNKIIEIADVLKNNSMALGFKTIHLVVEPGETSGFIDTNPLLPEKLMDSGVWIVAPICTETENMGYLLMKPTSFNGQACEEVRSSVSSALRNAMLFEAARKAQQVAKEAEQARTNFFANVGENLKDPLSEISEIVSGSSLDQETRKMVLEKVAGANNMIDLALGSTGELELNRYMTDMDSLLLSFDCYRKTTALPQVLVDETRIRQAIGSMVVSMGSATEIVADVQRRGVCITVRDNGGRWKPDKNDTELALAQRIILLHDGSCSVGGASMNIVLPFPTLSGNGPAIWDSDKTLACIGRKPPFDINGTVPVEIDGQRFADKKRLPADTGAVFWDSCFKGYNALTGLFGLVSNEIYRDMPFLCVNVPQSRTLEDSIRASVEEKGRVVLHVGPASEELYRWIQDPDVLSCDFSNAVSMARRHEPQLIIMVLEAMENRKAPALALATAIRGIKRISQTPIIISSDYLDADFVESIIGISNVIAVNSCILESEEFAMRVRAVLGGSEPLTTNTGSIVKKAQLYICSHATIPISRWQIADEVHVSEDYLTRVFKRELGLSPWDYLNRYRVWLAGTLLRNTGMSVNDVAEATGFQDQAYFCRVFKKIRGYSPSRSRTTKKSELSKKQ